MATLMTIRYERLDPDEVDNHQFGWIAIAKQLEVALGSRPKLGGIAR